MRPAFRSVVLVFALYVPLVTMARPATLAECAAIAEDKARLACFDALAAGQAAPSVTQPRADEAPQAAGTRPLPPRRSDPFSIQFDQRTEASSLAEQWEVGEENKRGVFAFRPHHPNYLLVNYNPSPNEAPYRALRGPNAPGLAHSEIAFQLGFKMKLAENVFATPADFWFGYTQESYWQASNRSVSSPFRENNYQPELMVVAPVNFSLLGLRARFVNVGFVHQSNGQGTALSRSWNRVYVQAGLERGNFALLARVWHRIRESAETDDNPDITDYLGHGDLYATYRWRGHIFSALARYNPATNRGAARLGWAFPIAGNLKGYVQAFSGYGQTLIDYNASQTSLGFGVLLDF